MIQNPFIINRAVQDPDNFCGREGIVSNIINYLKHPEEMQSCSIIGEHRIGKTSLINHLISDSTRKIHGLDNPETVFLHLDMTGFLMISKFNFWKTIFEEITEITGDESIEKRMYDFLKDGVISSNEINRFFRLVKKRGYRIYFFFDEFDACSTNPEFDPAFFLTLRYLAGQFGVTYITSSRLSLIDLEYRNKDAIKTSPFFNIFINIPLTVFSRNEAEEMLNRYLKETDISFTDTDRNLIFSLAGNHPFFLNVAGHSLFEAYVNNIEDKDEYCRHGFQNKAMSTLRSYWQHFDDEEKRVLMGYAIMDLDIESSLFKTLKIKESIVSNQYESIITDRLKISGFLVESNNTITGLKVFSEPFAKWIFLVAMNLLKRSGSRPEIEASASVVEWLRDMQKTSVCVEPEVITGDSGRSTEKIDIKQEILKKSQFRYEIIDTLGVGGMAKVFLVQDKILERKVALKVVSYELVDDESFVQRFQQEMKALASLKHKNIVHLYDVAADRTYFTMEHVEGPSLRKYLNDLNSQDKTMSVNEAFSFAVQIAEALVTAHEVGITHRDIKPENILIDNFGDVKVADFGLARMKGMARKTLAGQLLGTVLYMSPEQFDGLEDIDYRTDIYSLGLVVCEMITGRPPQRMGGIFTVDLPMVKDFISAQLNEDQVQEATQLLEKCLQPDREQRRIDLREFACRFKSLAS